MKTTFLFFMFIFLQLPAFSNASNICPSEMVVAIDCTDTDRDFQLLKHLGKYSQPKLELSSDQKEAVCSYGVSEWVSKYKYRDNAGEKVATVTSLQELSPVADIIQRKGFGFDYDKKTGPFTLVTYKQEARGYRPEQMFLFSGLESTFGKDNLAVMTNDSRVSTVVINDRYFKSQNVATDTFVTGSDCVIRIR